MERNRHGRRLPDLRPGAGLRRGGLRFRALGGGGQPPRRGNARHSRDGCRGEPHRGIRLQRVRAPGLRGLPGRERRLRDERQGPGPGDRPERTVPADLRFRIRVRLRPRGPDLPHPVRPHGTHVPGSLRAVRRGGHGPGQRHPGHHAGRDRPGADGRVRARLRSGEASRRRRLDLPRGRGVRGAPRNRPGGGGPAGRPGRGSSRADSGSSGSSSVSTTPT